MKEKIEIPVLGEGKAKCIGCKLEAYYTGLLYVLEIREKKGNIKQKVRNCPTCNSYVLPVLEVAA